MLVIFFSSNEILLVNARNKTKQHVNNCDCVKVKDRSSLALRATS